MKVKFRYYRLILLRHDLPAALSVFFVALPLCLGIALACGAPLSAGLLSGIIGGLIVPLISKSPLSVSGPAAGLTTVVAAAIISYGDFNIFLLTVIVAGLLQVLLGTFRLGTFASYFPSSVIRGMLAAIGVMLIAKQIPFSLGYDKPGFWSDTFGHALELDVFFNTILNTYRSFASGAILITIVSLILLFTLDLKIMRRLKIIPAPLLVVIIGVLLSKSFTSSPSLALDTKQLVHVPAHFFSGLKFPEFSRMFTDFTILKNGLIIGLLATLETLLCVEAIDKLDPLHRTSPPNRELVAQGVANMFCGFLGAIPVTAVIVRGSANVNAGARTNLSAFMHGVFLLLSVIAIPFLLNMIPYASLSAILLVTGYNLAKPSIFLQLFRQGWKQFLPFLITFFSILLTDLLLGVSIGLVLSIFYIIRENFKKQFKIHTEPSGHTTLHTIKLGAEVTFLNKVALKDALEKIPEYSTALIDGTQSDFIDHDILEIIAGFESVAHRKHIALELRGIKKVELSQPH